MKPTETVLSDRFGLDESSQSLPKLSFGTQSAPGSRFVETMLTVIETCRQQGRPVFTYLTEAVQAHFADFSCPSLLSGG